MRAEGEQRCAESQGHDELGSQLPPEQLDDLAGLFGELGEVVPGGGELGPQLAGDLLAPSGDGGVIAGAWVVGYGTSIGELAVMGAITGIPLGAVQAFLLRGRVARSWMWAAAMPLLWALGWTVTAAAGVGVDSQYTVFGAFGAITFMALSGVLLDRLRAATPSARHVPPTATA